MLVDRLPPIAAPTLNSQPRQGCPSQKKRLKGAKPEAGGGEIDEGEEGRGSGQEDEARLTNTRSAIGNEIDSRVGVRVTKAQITGRS